MGKGFKDYGEYFFIAIGIYCIVVGFITLTTGKINPREQARLGDISENGLKRYKLLSAVFNIIGGLLTIAVSVVRMFNLIERNVFVVIVLSVVVLLIIGFIVARNSCKKVK